MRSSTVPGMYQRNQRPDHSSRQNRVCLIAGDGSQKAAGTVVSASLGRCARAHALEQLLSLRCAAWAQGHPQLERRQQCDHEEAGGGSAAVCWRGPAGNLRQQCPRVHRDAQVLLTNASKSSRSLCARGRLVLAHIAQQAVPCCTFIAGCIRLGIPLDLPVRSIASLSTLKLMHTTSDYSQHAYGLRCSRLLLSASSS